MRFDSLRLQTLLFCGVAKNPLCKNLTFVWQGYDQRSSLGPLTGRGDGLDVTRDTVFYRCRNCRRKVPIHYGTSLFQSAGAGSWSIRHAALSLWNFVEGIDLTHTVHQLEVDEKVVSRLVF